MKNKYENTNSYIRSTNRLLTLFTLISVLLSFPVKGQIPLKKNLTEADYPLWHYCEAEEISDNGNWISYKKTYDTADSLFVQNRKTGKKYSFPSASKGQFVSDNTFVYKTSGDQMHLFSLKKGIEQLLKKIKGYELFGSYLLTMSDQKENRTLDLYNLEGQLLHTLDNVTTYALSPDKKKIAVSIRVNDRNTVLFMDIAAFGERTKIAEDVGAPFENLTWSSDGTVLVFLHYGDLESKLYYKQLNNKFSSIFSTVDSRSFPTGMNISPTREIKISNDNKKVFFRIKQRKELKVIHKKNEVQIWNTADKYIYPLAREMDGFNSLDKRAIWEPLSGRYFQITDNQLPRGAAAGAMNYALTYNPQDYEPQSDESGDRDVYITDLNTRNRKLLLKKYSPDTSSLLASPGGKYIAYVKDGNWFVYDVHKDTHTRVNDNIPYPLKITSDMHEEVNYDNPGWTSDDNYLLLNDQYDIWKVSPDGNEATRLTKGREKGIIYRIIPQTKSQKKKLDGWIYTTGVFNLDDGLVLMARNTDSFYNGIFQWDQKKGLSKITYTDKKISTILRSKNNVFAWLEEDTNQPWQIKVKEPNTKVTLVMRSNLQQEKYNWTKRELVTYQNQKGETLKGILYYPTLYQKGKKYPMIVHIYEKQSSQIHFYYLPTFYNEDGFNIANLTSKGYFVLLPDINYDTGNVGLSAVDCVEAAVKAVIKEHDIDDSKIGLIGHSFGGFQTDFIITHSKLFTCAVAGSATTNFLSSYLAVAENAGIPNFAKIEYGQARMNVSPYENMDRYLQNSPVMHAANVTTPLLSWTGLKDQQVVPTQSFEFYMALRRLGKTHIMLAYPEEGHGLIVKENAIDLTRRIEEWFDYYLKQSNKPTWFK